MLNNVVLIGRVFALENNLVTIKVSNKNDEIEDLISARLNDNVNDSVQEYCGVGDVIGIKGHLKSDENGLYLQAEKVTFLVTKEKNNED